MKKDSKDSNLLYKDWCGRAIQERHKENKIIAIGLVEIWPNK